MTALGRGNEQGRGSGQRRLASAGVLADRMAAALVHHEPGWRLPRLTALARRYNVSAAEVDAAIGELAARHLVRRLPDGQVYRASPAEYLVPLEGVAGLRSYVDPMGGQLACKTRHTSRRRPPEDIGRSLRLAPGEAAFVIRCLWTVGGEPAALSASYLPERLAASMGSFPEPAQPPAPADAPDAADPLLGADEVAPNGDPDHPGQAGTAPDVAVTDPSPGGVSQPSSFLFPWGPGAAGSGQPRALQIELGLPPPAVARSLRLAAGEPVATLTVIFADPVAGSPMALTMTMLRPALFRVVLEAPAAPDLSGSGEDLPPVRAWLPAALPDEEP